MAISRFYTERELLERLAYLGPGREEGMGVQIEYEWTGAVTEATLWTPQSGNRFVVSLITINTSAACVVSIFDEVDDDINILFKGSLAQNDTIVIPYPMPRVSSGDNRKLQITTSATGGYVTIWGWETGLSFLTTSTSTSTSTSSVSTSTISTSSSSQSTSSTSITTISTSSSSHTTSSSSTSSSSSSSTSSISQTVT